MQRGMRPRTQFLPIYHGYFLRRTHGRVFAYPCRLEDDFLSSDRLLNHPAVLSAATIDEVKALIDASDVRPFLPETVGRFDGHDIVRLGTAFYGVPASAGPLDLNDAEARRRPDVLRGDSAEEVRRRILAQRAAAPVEFAGWLPVYALSGNCGRHPQFTHTAEPPDGYHFTCSAPPPPRPSFWQRFGTRLADAAVALGRKARVAFGPFVAACRPTPGVSVWTRLRVLAAMLTLLLRLWRRGAKLRAILGFLRTRHLHSQQLLASGRPGAVFLTSMPYTFNQAPWVIEIEDPTTLFYPLIHNGYTCEIAVEQTSWFPIVQALLEADQCKAILTHLRSTARMLPTLFGSEAVARKVIYAPLGVRVPPRWQRHDRGSDDEPIDLLFINSWCQVPGNFFVRGGADLLEAFAVLRERYPQLRLTLRTELPPLAPYYHHLLESGWVRVIDRFLSAEEMEELHAQSHIFLLPSARVHIVSLLQAMSYGLAVVASDGWGIEEYLEDGRNGLVVRGRYGKVSWADEEAGVLREDYGPMFTPDPDVVQGIVDAVSRLVEDRQLRARLGRAARADVETKYHLDGWNRAVGAALDLAHGVERDEATLASAARVA